MKKLIKAILALVVIFIALVLAHPLWIGPVVRTAVSQLAPKFLGVPAQLDGFSLNAYTGRMTLDGFVLDNPPGYPEKFVKIGHLCVDVNPTTVLSDVIVVEEITLDDLYASLLTDTDRVYNYKRIAETCASSQPKKPAEPAEKASEKESAAHKEKSVPKVVIDLIQMRNALVLWNGIPLPLPSFRMTGLGRGTNGVGLDVAWKELQQKFISSLGPLAKGLQGSLADAQKSLERLNETAQRLNETAARLNGTATKQLDDAAKQLGTVAKPLEGTTKVLGNATKSVTDLTAQTIGGATGSASDATKSVTEGSKKTIETTTKALGEGVKSLKSLFGN